MRMKFLLVAVALLAALTPAAADSITMGVGACIPIVSHVGSTFTITLPANRTTGYSWALEDPVNSAVVAYRLKLYSPDTPGVMGGPGEEKWTFAAVGRGRTLISLKYARPWERSAPPAKEALYVVVVR